MGVLTPLEMHETEGPWTSLLGALSEGSGGFHSLGTWRDRTSRVGGEKWGPNLKLESPLLGDCREKVENGGVWDEEWGEVSP